MASKEELLAKLSECVVEMEDENILRPDIRRLTELWKVL